MMAATPRVFLVRHGETEWSLSGKHTGRTDIPLTRRGEQHIRATGRALVGDDRLIAPRKLVPYRTFELLNLGIGEDLPWTAHGHAPCDGLACGAHVEVTETIREWYYGDYEGMTSREIRSLRADQGHPGIWDIWRDGCPGGESPAQVTQRLDALIAEIRDKWHRPAMNHEAPPDAGVDDVLIVAHGHILRALAMRWVGKALEDGPAFLLEAGGIGTLSYEHNNFREPAILLGGAFFVDASGEGSQKQDS